MNYSQLTHLVKRIFPSSIQIRVFAATFAYIIINTNMY